KATTYLDANKYDTYSIISLLLKEIKNRIKSENTSSQNVNMKKIADDFVKKEEEETLISVLLNLRIKSFEFIEFINNNEVHNKTKNLLKNKYNQPKANY
ncbi:2187_t:CDS:1, partial [Funneliformis geosporum]